MSNPPRAVIDTCVLFKVTLQGVLLQTAASGLFQPVWSEGILEELKRNWLKHPLFRGDPKKVTDAVTRLGTLFPEAMVRLRNGSERNLSIAASDRHVLALAMTAKAPLIVTDNLKDFPDAALQPHGVRAISPDAFLMQLLQADGDAVQEAVETYAAYGAKPPETVFTVLQRLEVCHAPVFAQSMHERLGR